MYIIKHTFAEQIWQIEIFIFDLKIYVLQMFIITASISHSAETFSNRHLVTIHCVIFCIHKVNTMSQHGIAYNFKACPRQQLAHTHTNAYRTHTHSNGTFVILNLTIQPEKEIFTHDFENSRIVGMVTTCALSTASSVEQNNFFPLFAAPLTVCYPYLLWFSFRRSMPHVYQS